VALKVLNYSCDRCEFDDYRVISCGDIGSDIRFEKYLLEYVEKKEHKLRCVLLLDGFDMNCDVFVKFLNQLLDLGCVIPIATTIYLPHLPRVQVFYFAN
jgi:hypothetical protein